VLFNAGLRSRIQHMKLNGFVFYGGIQLQREPGFSQLKDAFPDGSGGHDELRSKRGARGNRQLNEFGEMEEFVIAHMSLVICHMTTGSQ
jgi:hypothetical protein